MDEKVIKQEFDQQGKLLMRILEILERNNLLAKDIWDNSDLKRYLNISDSSIKRYRKAKIFKPFYIGKSPRYYRDEILPLRNQFLKIIRFLLISKIGVKSKVEMNFSVKA